MPDRRLAHEIMTRPVITLPDTATVHEAAGVMLEHGVGGLPIVDADGRLVGMLTESDFLTQPKGVPFSTFRAPALFNEWFDSDRVEQMYRQARQLQIGGCMKKDVVTVDEQAPLGKVLDLLMEHDINRVPVVREGRPVGIITRRDILKLMRARVEAE